MEGTFTAVFEKVPGGFIGYAAELPGANTQGATLDEARANLREAVELILLANRDLSLREQSGKDVVREEIRIVVG